MLLAGAAHLCTAVGFAAGWQREVLSWVAPLETPREDLLRECSCLEALDQEGFIDGLTREGHACHRKPTASSASLTSLLAYCLQAVRLEWSAQMRMTMLSSFVPNSHTTFLPASAE